ncbi:MAG: glucans biosynthesis glucosyltransferase MdoH [Verrucomicrobiota bacterium JB024]|nr:glucans biosynthesis glucosyltransferase MdoH [Verrucomicrobiota bacterium JB024]
MSAEPQSTSTTPAGGFARPLFFGLHAVLTVCAGAIYWDLLNRAGFTATSFLLLVLFVILFAHITFGFLQPLFGLVIALRGNDPRSITRTVDLDQDPATIKLTSRTALIFPIYNEDPDRFFAGVETVYRRLKALGQIEHYDVFVLSDSTDADNWIAEEIAWNETAVRLGAHGKLFYRRRRNNINQKSGNVSDFCRRWAGSYDYMLCFDADSLMSGECIVRMTEMIERNPQVGILQTMPGLLNGRTLLARLQQFTNRVHGHLSGAGLNAWQQDYGNYWGHNAIIRLKPFLKYCTLPELPGVEPLGGRVLSHDFVEAMLMHKAGYEVWLAYDLCGSYEEMPPTLIDMAKRDRRWCQGNLQHAWLVLFGKIPYLSRIHMVNGIMGYISSPLWLLFLGLVTLATYRWVGSDLTLVVRDSAFSFMPETLAEQGLLLLGLTAFMIFGPKLMTLAWLAFRPGVARSFGGWPRAAASVLCEIFFFTLIAPSMMLFHSGFVLTILLGQKVKWSTQVRDSGDGTPWRAALAAQGGHLVVGLLWGALAWTVSPTLFWWMSPVLLGWLLAVPLSVYTSRESAGQWFRRRGLLLTPEETEPSPEVCELRSLTAEGPQMPAHMERFEDIGLLGVVLDPYINALHGLLMREKSQPDPNVRETLRKLEHKLLQEGAEALNNAEKMRLLLDYESIVRLHKQVWSQPDHRLSPWWQQASRSYTYRMLFHQRGE